MSYGKAGMWGPEVVLNGSVTAPLPLPATSITVRNMDGSAATCYTDRTATTTTSNVIVTDSMGQLTFFAMPGQYKLHFTNSLGAQMLPITVHLDPADLAPDVFGSGTYSAIAKDAINAKNYATGDGVTDDTVGLAAALVAARGKSLFLPDGTYLTTAELLHDAATHGPIRIFGGPNAIIKLTGVSNKGIHVTGTPGVTRAYVTLEGFQILGATSGVSPAAVHLDGIADYQIHDLIISPRAKFTTGVTFTGTQQGEWSGGYVEAATVGKFELSGSIASNGCDMHGVSGSFSSAGLTFAGVDTAFIRGNHLTGAGPVGIDVLSGGLGQLVFANNHFELTTTAGIRLAASTNQCFISGNSFFGNAGSTDLLVSGGARHTIIGNLFNRDVTLAAAASGITFVGNHVLAAFTDSSTGATVLGNSGNAVGGVLSRTGLLFTTGNASIGNTSGDTYIEAGGAVQLRIAGFGAGFRLDGSNVIDLVSAATTTAAPPAGGAGALPATPLGYIRIKIGGTLRKIPYYEDA